MSPTRNTPLTARSVLASVLLGTDPPWLPTPSSSARRPCSASARAARGRPCRAWSPPARRAAEDGGYRLVGRLVARQQRQTASRRAETRSWDGTWELATVDGDARRAAADRAALREALRALRLVELREGVWGRPDNLDPDRSPEAAAVVGALVRPLDRAPARTRRRTSRRSSDSPTGPRPPAPCATRWRRCSRPLERGDTGALADGFVDLGRRPPPPPGRPAPARRRSSRRAGPAPPSAPSTTATTPPTGATLRAWFRAAADLEPTVDAQRLGRFRGRGAASEPPEHTVRASAGRGGGRPGWGPTGRRRAGSGRGRSG